MNLLERLAKKSKIAMTKLRVRKAVCGAAAADELEKLQTLEQAWKLHFEQGLTQTAEQMAYRVLYGKRS